MLQTCLGFVLIQFRLYNPNCFTLKKGVSGLCNPKHHVTRPIFEVSGVQNPEKSVTPFFTL